MCEILDVSRSGYYAWKRGKRSKRMENDKRSKELVKKTFKDSRKTYGARRIAKKLRKDGQHISNRKIRELMKEEGLVAIQNKQYKATTNSNHTNEVASNLLEEREIIGQDYTQV